MSRNAAPGTLLVPREEMRVRTGAVAVYGGSLVQMPSLGEDSDAKHNVSPAMAEDVVDWEIHRTHPLAGLVLWTTLETYAPLEFD